VKPPRYTLHAEPADARRKAKPQRLRAATLEDAKLEAAIVFACAEHLPAAYRIVEGVAEVVYRYPEPALAAA
jgi:hypothetical protein